MVWCDDLDAVRARWSDLDDGCVPELDAEDIAIYINGSKRASVSLRMCGACVYVFNV